MAKKETKPILVSVKSNSLDRVPTGIPGFDNLVQGGFPFKSPILVAGGPGTGKTIFAMQFLINGSTKYNDKGLYVSFEQTRDEIVDQSKQFGWDIDKLEKDGKIKLMIIDVEEITEKIIEDLKKVIEKEGIKRLVIDSLSTLLINAPIYTSCKSLSVTDVVGDNINFSPPIIGDYVVRRFLYKFISSLRVLNCTSVLISESGHDGYISRDTVSEFICSGVVALTSESMGGGSSRSMIIKKMRRTKNNEEVHSIEINEQGMSIQKV